jgi:hypothetical protein
MAYAMYIFKTVWNKYESSKYVKVTSVSDLRQTSIWF